MPSRCATTAEAFGIDASALQVATMTRSMSAGDRPLLASALRHVGHRAIRNRGTLGGSVAHADPAADYPASLLALEARVRLVSADSDRIISLEEFLVDTMTTAIEPGEIVREVIVPVEGHPAGAQSLRGTRCGNRSIQTRAEIEQRSFSRISETYVGIPHAGHRSRAGL